jgi:hypothetical protein
MTRAEFEMVLEGVYDRYYPKDAQGNLDFNKDNAVFNLCILLSKLMGLGNLG